MGTMILVAAAGIAAGFAVGFLVAYMRQSELRAEAEGLRARLAESRAAADEAMRREREGSREALERERERSREAMERMRESLESTISQMRAQVNSVTADMLRCREEEFESRSKKTMEGLTAPLHRTIEQMREAMADNTRVNADLGGRLSANIRQVMEQSEAARRAADRLANVLRAGGKTQGDCGEIILRELLESQNLKEGRHFETQAFITDEKGANIISDDGQKMQPDVILHLGHDRFLMIDSKVSLTAYFDYCDAETDEARKNALTRHIASLEKHVADLARKNYGGRKHLGKDPLEFTVMFVPYSSALRLAMREKPSFWRDALDRRVYIADEETLFAAIKIVAMTWQADERAQNHEKVFGLADELISRVNDFLISYSEIGRTLNAAQEAYGRGYSKLTPGGQSIPTTCLQLKALGARTALKGKKREHELLNNAQFTMHNSQCSENNSQDSLHNAKNSMHNAEESTDGHGLSNCG